MSMPSRLSIVWFERGMASMLLTGRGGAALAQVEEDDYH